MDNSVCASCHRGLSLEEIERGSFKQLGGKVYCADCVAKMRRVGPTVCPSCGARDTPLYNGSAYVCRKCGAELRPAGKTGAAKPSTSSRSRKQPRKKCPYCGAVLPAESLKCRYCGSSLTREARDLDTLTQQNLRLRFWLGCLLTASVFLFCLTVYLLMSWPGPREQAAAPSPAPATAAQTKPATEKGSARLLAQVADLRDQVASLQAELATARRAEPPPKPEEPSPRPETRVEPAPPKPSPKPQTAVAAKPKPSPEPKTGQPAAAQRAEAAFPVFQEKLQALKADRDYAGAIALCRQFLAVHLNTPAAKRVAATQKRLRDEIETLRDEHIRR
ncbi:MAG: hypothetical protein ACODAJ_15890, partial [Planctomycetota bacterium]